VWAVIKCVDQNVVPGQLMNELRVDKQQIALRKQISTDARLIRGYDQAKTIL
jgi:hypothetical protein